MKILPLSLSSKNLNNKLNSSKVVTTPNETSPLRVSFQAKLITKTELTQRLSKIGLAEFKGEALAQILNLFATSKGYSTYFLEMYENLARKMDENKIKKTPLMQLLMTELNPNLERFEKTLDKMLDVGISSDHIVSIFECAKDNDSFVKEINYGKIKKLLRCRELGIENKEVLSHKPEIVSDEDINCLFFELPQMTLNMYDILGEKAFVYSFKDKIDNVIDYLVLLGRDFDDTHLKDKLILKINPTATYDYYSLVSEIEDLKQKYKSCLDRSLISSIEKQIATLTRKKNDMIENSIKDPKMVLETALIVSNFGTKAEIANEILDVANPQTNEEILKYNEILNEKICLLLGENISSELIKKKLDFTKSKSLPRIYTASGEFKRQFKKLIKLLEENPGKTNLEIFNSLPQNIKTKDEFKKRLIDYDRYTDYNPDSYIELVDDSGKKNGIKIRKSNMNDIPKVISLGQDADCCTKVGGRKDFASIGYLKNKFISAIEVLDEDVCIGNTMCYFAEVEGKLSFILDNLAFKPRYRYDSLIANGVYEYAQILCDEVGRPDIPIYLAGQRHQVETTSMPVQISPINIIGNSGKDSIYLDFQSKLVEISNDKTLYAIFTKIN